METKKKIWEPMDSSHLSGQAKKIREFIIVPSQSPRSFPVVFIKNKYHPGKTSKLQNV